MGFDLQPRGETGVLQSHIAASCFCSPLHAVAVHCTQTVRIVCQLSHTPALLASASAEVLLCLAGSSCDDMLNEVYHSLTNINSKLASLPYCAPPLLTALPLESGCCLPAALELQWQ